MASKVRTVAIPLDREEIQWAYVKTTKALMNATEITKRFDGKPNLSDEQAFKLQLAKEAGALIAEHHKKLEAILTKGVKERQARAKDIHELDEIVQYATEGEARDLAEAHKKELVARRESYDAWIIDRAMLKALIKLVHDDIDLIRSSILPAIEKRDDSYYKDRMRPRSYYINKNTASKTILEELLKKLEKRL